MFYLVATCYRQGDDNIKDIKSKKVDNHMILGAFMCALLKFNLISGSHLHSTFQHVLFLSYSKKSSKRGSFELSGASFDSSFESLVTTSFYK